MFDELTESRTYLDAAMLNLEVAAGIAHGQGHKTTVAKCRRALDLLAQDNPSYQPSFNLWSPLDNATK